MSGGEPEVTAVDAATCTNLAQWFTTAAGALDNPDNFPGFSPIMRTALRADFLRSADRYITLSTELDTL